MNTCINMWNNTEIFSRKYVAVFATIFSRLPPKQNSKLLKISTLQVEAVRCFHLKNQHNNSDNRWRYLQNTYKFRVSPTLTKKKGGNIYFSLIEWFQSLNWLPEKLSKVKVRRNIQCTGHNWLISNCAFLKILMNPIWRIVRGAPVYAR